MNQKDFWNNAQLADFQKEWVKRPNLFAEECLSYFPKQGKLLDLAAGQGKDSIFFATKGYQVTCTDLTEYALKRAKENAEEQKLSLSFKNVDLSEPLPFNDEEFDIVYSHLGLHYFVKEKTQFLFKEIHRILKPKGIIVTIFNTIDDPEIKDTRYKKIEEQVYQNPQGLIKSYFSVDYLKEIINGLFKEILLDNKGKVHKEWNKSDSLIRFMGKRI